MATATTKASSGPGALLVLAGLWLLLQTIWGGLVDRITALVGRNPAPAGTPATGGTG